MRIALAIGTALLAAGCFLDEVSLANRRCELPGHPCVQGWECVSGTCQQCADRDGDTLLSTACGGADCDDGDANVKPGAGEICANTKDDDCNGEADLDDAACRCSPGETRECPGECAGTKQTCDGGVYGACVAPVEACNGRDDDCDGDEDEGFACALGATEPCTTSCGSAGTRRCEAGCSWGSCVAEEFCDGADNDCDDLRDEGFECTAGERTTCTTACGSEGFASCGATCSPGECEPPDETCNGRDDDCSGAPDDAFLCVRGALSDTECQTSCGTKGRSACNDTCDAFDRCVPPAEICNGADDDCAGGIDDALTAPSRVAQGNADAIALAARDGFVAFAITSQSGVKAGVADTLALTSPSTAPRTSLAGRPNAAGPAVAIGSQSVLVAWTEQTDLRVAFLTREGAVRTAEASLGAVKDGTRPRAAWSGDGSGRFALTWISGDRVHAATFDASGTRVAGPQSLPNADIHASAKFSSVAPIPGQQAFAVSIPTTAAGGSMRPVVRRLTHAGTLESVAEAVLPATTFGDLYDEGFELAAGDTHLVAAYAVSSGGSPVVVATRWSPGSAPAPAVRVSPSGRTVLGAVRVAGHPAGYAVTWAELPDTATELVTGVQKDQGAARVQRIDEVNAGEYVGSGLALEAAVAWDGATFWYAWVDTDQRDAGTYNALVRRICP